MRVVVFDALGLQRGLQRTGRRLADVAVGHSHPQQHRTWVEVHKDGDLMLSSKALYAAFTPAVTWTRSGTNSI